MCAHVCTSISVQWDSPLVLKWWSNLFSCPLSLTGTSKNYCLLISEGAAGYLQVLNESAHPLLHILPSLLLYESMPQLCRKSALPQKLCLDFKSLSVVAPHFFHLGFDKVCFNVPTDATFSIHPAWRTLQKLLQYKPHGHNVPCTLIGALIFSVCRQVKEEITPLNTAQGHTCKTVSLLY